MHPRLAELVDYAQAQRAVLLTAVALIPEPLGGCRSKPDGWSLAEVLEHLHRVERGIARLAARALERGRAAGVGPERDVSSVMGSLDAFHLTRRGRPISAPGPVQPRGEYSVAQALAALRESREALLSALRAGDGLALAEINYPHPLLGPLNLYQWVLFVGQHEARHAAQIQELAQDLAET